MNKLCKLWCAERLRAVKHAGTATDTRIMSSTKSTPRVTATPSSVTPGTLGRGFHKDHYVFQSISVTFSHRCLQKEFAVSENVWGFRTSPAARSVNGGLLQPCAERQKRPSFTVTGCTCCDSRDVADNSH